MISEKQYFFRHNKIWRGTKNWGNTVSECPPWLRVWTSAPGLKKAHGFQQPLTAPEQGATIQANSEMLSRFLACVCNFPVGETNITFLTNFPLSRANGLILPKLFDNDQRLPEDIFCLVCSKCLLYVNSF